MNVARLVETQWRAVMVVIVLLAVGGIVGMTRVPLSLFPTTDFPRVIIVVENGEAPAQQMLITVTRPVEEAMSGIPGIARIRSVTSRGATEIDLFFDWRTNIEQTLQVVQARLSQMAATLPPTASVKRVERLTFAVFPILGYSVTSVKRDPGTLRTLSELLIRPPLARVPGVASVGVQGGDVHEYHAAIDPARLEARGLTVAQVVDALQSGNAVESPGLIEENHQLELALVSGQAKSIDDLGRIAVGVVNEVPVLLSDVATITPGFEPRYTIVTADGQPAVLINVLRQPTANTVALADALKQQLQTLERQLPRDVKVTPYYDQSLLVRGSVSSVRDAILIGLVLSVLILYGFLRNWGTTLVATLVIPVTILVTILAMWLIGLSFDLMTLGGVAAAIGLIIDDAIVVVENIYAHAAAGASRTEAVRLAMSEITGPIVFSTITPVVVFLPLSLLTGVTGVFFRSLALTMTVALLTSLVLALFFTPVLARRFVGAHEDKRAASSEDERSASSEQRSEAGSSDRGSRIADRQDDLSATSDQRSAPGAPDRRSPLAAREDGPSASSEQRSEAGSPDRRSPLAARQDGRSPLADRFITWYERLLELALRHTRVVLLLILALLGVSYFVYRILGSEFLPEFDEGAFILDYSAPPGASLAETNRILLHVERLLKETPDVESFSRRTGMELGLAGVTEPNTGDFAVKLKDKHRDPGEVIDELRVKIETSEPALRVEFIGILSDLIGDLASSPSPVEIRLYSEDQAALHRTARAIAASIAKVQGVVEIFDGIVVSGPAVTFRIDPLRAATYGVTAADVTSTIEAALGGVNATSIIERGVAVNVRVTLPDAYRLSLDAVRTLRVHSPVTNGFVRIDQLATIEYDPGQTEINRDGLRQSIAVTARLEGADLGSAISSIQAQLAQDVHLPAGMSLEYGGLYQEQQSSFRELAFTLLLAVALVFLVLLIEFRSFAHPVAIVTGAVLALSGTLIALLITGTTLNVVSLMGMIMIVGIVAKNGILMLDTVEDHLAAGDDLHAALVRSGRRRFRPVLMTSLAAMLGMLPLALALGSGAELLQPLAIAVIGGLAFALLLSLVVTPTVYAMIRKEGSS